VIFKTEKITFLNVAGGEEEYDFRGVNVFYVATFTSLCIENT